MSARLAFVSVVALPRGECRGDPQLAFKSRAENISARHPNRRQPISRRGAARPD